MSAEDKDVSSLLECQARELSILRQAVEHIDDSLGSLQRAVAQLMNPQPTAQEGRSAYPDLVRRVRE